MEVVERILHSEQAKVVVEVSSQKVTVDSSSKFRNQRLREMWMLQVDTCGRQEVHGQQRFGRTMAVQVGRNLKAYAWEESGKIYNQRERIKDDVD